MILEGNMALKWPRTDYIISQRANTFQSSLHPGIICGKEVVLMH